MKGAPEQIWVEDERDLGGSLHVFAEPIELVDECCAEYVRADLYHALAFSAREMARLLDMPWQAVDGEYHYKQHEVDAALDAFRKATEDSK